MEFSKILADFGAHLILLEYAPSPLMMFDRDLVTMLVKEPRNHGVEIWASRNVNLKKYSKQTSLRMVPDVYQM